MSEKEFKFYQARGVIAITGENKKLIDFKEEISVKSYKDCVVCGNLVLFKCFFKSISLLNQENLTNAKKNYR